jgi:hypothetical protein
VKPIEPALLLILLTACSNRPLLMPGRDGTGGDAATGSVGDLAMKLADGGARLDLAAADLANLDPLAAQCLTGGNVVYFDGDANDYIYGGIKTLQVTSWHPFNTGTPDTFTASVIDPSEANAPWSFVFSSQQLNEPLAVGTYTGASRWPFEAAGQPGFDVFGDGRGCNTVSGWFAIQSIAGGPNSGDFTEITATFEHRCEGAPPVLRGCVHFE